MFHIVLHCPEIPPNTGNIIRLAANTGATLHLVEPLGFTLDEKRLRRAGLDYREMADVHLHRDWLACKEALHVDAQIYALTTRGTVGYHTVSFKAGDVLLFGAETCGLPEAIHQELAASQKLRLPMCQDSRSMNLSNTVAVVLFEALRQTGFQGLQ